MMTPDFFAKILTMVDLRMRKMGLEVKDFRAYRQDDTPWGSIICIAARNHRRGAPVIIVHFSTGEILKAPLGMFSEDEKKCIWIRQDLADTLHHIFEGVQDGVPPTVWGVLNE